MRSAHRRRYVNRGTAGEYIACVIMSAVIVGVAAGFISGIAQMLSSKDAYTRCIVLHSHNTCASTLR